MDDFATRLESRLEDLSQELDTQDAQFQEACNTAKKLATSVALPYMEQLTGPFARSVKHTGTPTPTTEQTKLGTRYKLIFAPPASNHHVRLEIRAFAQAEGGEPDAEREEGGEPHVVIGVQCSWSIGGGNEGPRTEMKELYTKTRKDSDRPFPLNPVLAKQWYENELTACAEACLRKYRAILKSEKDGV